MSNTNSKIIGIDLGTTNSCVAGYHQPRQNRYFHKERDGY